MLDVGVGERDGRGEALEKPENEEEEEKARVGDLVKITTLGTSVGRRSLGMFCVSEKKSSFIDNVIFGAEMKAEMKVEMKAEMKAELR